ncbi:MAG: hypothetical protein ACYDDU_13430 [Dermatophilaceae bacterium]
MRFGLFLPQGWRLDLAGIDPADQWRAPEQVAETLRGLQADGMTDAVCHFAEAAYDLSGIELFEREVVPELSA